MGLEIEKRTYFVMKKEKTWGKNEEESLTLNFLLLIFVCKVKGILNVLYFMIGN